VAVSHRVNCSSLPPRFPSRRKIAGRRHKHLFMLQLATHHQQKQVGGAKRHMAPLVLRSRLRFRTASQHWVSLCAHTLTASALVPLLLCCRAKQEVQISSFTKRKGSRRTRLLLACRLLLILRPPEEYLSDLPRFGLALSAVEQFRVYLRPRFRQRHEAASLSSS